MSYNELYIFHNKAFQPQRQLFPEESQFIPVSDLESTMEGFAFSIEIPVLGLQNISIVPAFSMVSETTYKFSVGARFVEDSRARSDWVFLDKIGDLETIKPIENLENINKSIASEIDTFEIRECTGSVIQLRVKIFTQESMDLKLLRFIFSVSCFTELLKENFTLQEQSWNRNENIHIQIPQISQFQERRPLQRRVCAPISTSMVLKSFGFDLSNSDLVDLAYHARRDLFGVWAANIWAASNYGALGYVHRFYLWSSVLKLLKNGVPIITSIRYDEGELVNAAISKTPGHLLVLLGVQGDEVLVNDPAAYPVETVFRKYQIDQFLDVWLFRKGIGFSVLPWKRIFIN